MIDQVNIYTDGGSRGNPGPAGAAYIINDKEGRCVAARGLFLGHTTNNVAEYTAVREALKAAAKLARSIRLFSDSELLVRQLSGRYRVKSENLLDLYNECMSLLTSFSAWQVIHVPREKNTHADRLANRAMDKKTDVEGCPQAVPAAGGKPVRIGILLSGGGRTMLNIADEIKAARLNAEIVAVVSSLSTVQGVERARALGVEPAIVRRKDYPDLDAFSDAVAERMRAAKVDLIVQAGWLCLWKIQAAFENRVMNIHPALLPAFGGQGMWGHHVHEAVLKAGCKVSGCTVHFCTNEYDAGPIIIQRCCEVKDDDTPDSLAERVFQEECRAYPEAIRLFAAGRLQIVNGIVKRKV